MSNKTVDVERERERRMFRLFSFLFTQPTAANDASGGNNQRAQVQKRTYSGAYDNDKLG